MAGKKNFVLRINEEMYADLERWAGQEFRSVNGQIEYILHRAILERKGKTTKNKGASDQTGHDQNELTSP